MTDPTAGPFNAQILAAYREDLIAHGFTAAESFEMVLHRIQLVDPMDVGVTPEAMERTAERAKAFDVDQRSRMRLTIRNEGEFGSTVTDTR